MNAAELPRNADFAHEGRFTISVDPELPPPLRPPSVPPSAENGIAGGEDVEYVFVSLEDLPRSAQEDLTNAGELVLSGLLSDRPTCTIGGITYGATFDEDIGSTFYFDRASLQRLDELERRQVDELRILDMSGEAPLRAVTSKRLKLGLGTGSGMAAAPAAFEAAGGASAEGT